jgi:pimeloyl-ACP methyl ester carboxylesterase
MRLFLRVIFVLFVVSAVQAEEAAVLRIEPHTVKFSDGSEVAAEQGTLRVPANREKKDGKTIELYFIRVRATSAAKSHPTLYLAGGPGEDATGFLRGRSSAQATASFRSVGDLILLDQRGTGRSKPIPTCKDDTPPAGFLASAAADLAQMRAGIERCAAELRSKGIDVSAFNSRDAADDLEDLRRALGEEKLNLVGFSYGTHLALAAMRRHPGSIGRAVLIGTEGPAHTYKLPSTLDLQLRKLSLLAAASPSIGSEVPDMFALLQRVLAKLEKEPVTVTVSDRTSGKDVPIRVGKEGLLRILRRDVGDGNDFIAFPAMLLGIERGDPTLLGRYVQKRYNQSLRRGAALMPVVTDCSSGASPLRLAQIRAEEPGSVFGAFTNYPYPEICSAAGNPDLGEVHRGPFFSNIPTLFVSGTLDSNTPPYQAEEVRWGMTRGTHLIVENAGHEDTLPHPEVQRTILEFLRGEDVSARRIALPSPKFLSLEAAKEFKP